MAKSFSNQRVSNDDDADSLMFRSILIGSFSIWVWFWIWFPTTAYTIKRIERLMWSDNRWQKFNATDAWTAFENNESWLLKIDLNSLSRSNKQPRRGTIKMLRKFYFTSRRECNFVFSASFVFLISFHDSSPSTKLSGPRIPCFCSRCPKHVLRKFLIIGLR